MTQEDIEKKENRNNFVFISAVKSEIKYFALKKTIVTDDSLIVLHIWEINSIKIYKA